MEGFSDVRKRDEVTIAFNENNPLGKESGVVILKADYLELVAWTDSSQLNRACFSERFGNARILRF